MHFKKLELIGFKSFCDKTALNFEPGVTAIVGPNGCGKCLRYDSLVTLSDGSKIKIGDLVESAIAAAPSVGTLDDGFMVTENTGAINILSLNPETLKIEPRPISAFIKREAPEYLLEVKTKSGRTVVTTHYHPFFSIKGGQVVALTAEQLEVGVRIAAPRIITPAKTCVELDLFRILKKFSIEDQVFIPASEGLSIFLHETLSKSCAQAYSAPTLSKTEQTAVKCAMSGQAMNVAHFMKLLERAAIERIPDFVGSLKSRSSVKLTLPMNLSVPIARFLGYIISEGRTTRENQVWFVNEDKAMIKDFISSARLGFGAEAKAFRYKRSAQDVLIFSSALCRFLEKAFDFKVAALSADKTVPPQLFNADNKIIAEFISALFEGDGYLSTGRKGSGDYFAYSSASSALVHGVSSLLLRLGVHSVIRKMIKSATNTPDRKKGVYYSLYVYGAQNVSRLAGQLRFVGAKQVKLEALRRLERKLNPNLDLIPEINCLLKNLIKLSGVNIKRLRKISPKLSAYYENRCLPSRGGLLEVLSVIAEHGSLNGLARLIYGYLKVLAQSDIYWDEVISIKKTVPEKWVYDLSVADTHNFIAEDLVVHNSNIFDAIRWVLGEQSAKSLRGAEMMDVIFNGTDNKEPVGMAEVSLTLDNGQRFFDTDHPEVTITRRLFRSGESEYFLNRTPARLKDILDLLLGTGIGAESYSIVAQGKIDLVLSSRPEDRRLVFDEAAGITKYKSQKRETTRKLEETEQNLLRVNDIITEVKRQINSLERQANKARRYKEVFEELKSKETDLANFERKGLLRQKDNCIAELKSLEERESELLTVVRREEEIISSGRALLDQLQANMMSIKNAVLSLENSIVRNNQHIAFNKEKIVELGSSGKALLEQSGQLKAAIAQCEEKITKAKDEYAAVREDISLKGIIFSQKQAQINNIAAAIAKSLETISGAKAEIMAVATKISNTKNEVNEFSLRQQIYQARRKRLEVEKAKVYEEKAIAEQSLEAVNLQVESARLAIEDLNQKMEAIRSGVEQENTALAEVNLRMQDAENKISGLRSHKEFLEELKTKYDDIGESMNAVIYLDRMPQEKLSGLVIKVKDNIDFSAGEAAAQAQTNHRLSGEAKPVEMDTTGIQAKIVGLEAQVLELKENKEQIVKRLQILAGDTALKTEVLRKEEISLANKETSRNTILEQFNKAKEEEDLLVMEILDAEKEMTILGKKIASCRNYLSELTKEEEELQGSIRLEEENISKNGAVREELLVAATQVKTELDALNKRIAGDQETLNILEGACRQDRDNLTACLDKFKSDQEKSAALQAEIEDSAERNAEFTRQILAQNEALKEAEENYEQAAVEAGETAKKIDQSRSNLDAIKNNLHQLRMTDKDIDYKYSAVKERMLSYYKVDLETLPMPELDFVEEALRQEIERLREKADSYGAVNLVAIEEYDELKKRYDFLVQQQNDLAHAKESLHQAILKINRTTKEMFIETFNKVKVEFRNYFRMLFNGGDAQLYLTDEQDPLESGIEIICRPPGKKLQNVLLLSGGEKAMSAIALIFAIFKVKPSPFCILDEIDAALDEANVDRFGKMLQEFIAQSQFIVVTHNKRTIACADVMYGITMEQSGISKIVSVKFSENKAGGSEDENLVNTKSEQVV